MKKITIFLLLAMMSATALAVDIPKKAGPTVDVTRQMDAKWYQIDWQKFRTWKPIKWFFPEKPLPDFVHEVAPGVPENFKLRLTPYDPCRDEGLCDEEPIPGETP